MSETENKPEIIRTTTTESKKTFYMQIIAVVLLGGLLIFSLTKSPTSTGEVINTVSVPSSEILPTGTPRVYGEELKISYDDVSTKNPQLADATIRKLGQIDVSENLQGEQLKRFINIGYTMNGGIACEYCCGAQSVIFSDGQAACGCAHSYAMRGLAKYLIKYHGTEFTDEQIQEEMGKWKVLFFPGIHEAKAAALKSNGIELNYINLASNKYRGIEQGQSSGGMVGGC